MDSWVLGGQSGDHHPLTPVTLIRLGLRNPRKKEWKYSIFPSLSILRSSLSLSLLPRSFSFKFVLFCLFPSPSLPILRPILSPPLLPPHSLYLALFCLCPFSLALYTSPYFVSLPFPHLSTFCSIPSFLPHVLRLHMYIWNSWTRFSGGNMFPPFPRCVCVQVCWSVQITMTASGRLVWFLNRFCSPVCRGPLFLFFCAVSLVPRMNKSRGGLSLLMMGNWKGDGVHVHTVW